jgi:hypothetical protein
MLHGGLIDQLVKGINREHMEVLLSYDALAPTGQVHQNMWGDKL